MRRHVFPGRIVALVVCLGTAARGDDLRVPQDYASIQEAIAAAREGDVVLVAPGTYDENLDFVGKAITVRSVEGPEATIVDGGGRGSVVSFRRGEPAAAILEGFTIRGGSGTVLDSQKPYWSSGGGVLCTDEASPTIRGNRITDNHLVEFGAGGGIFCGPGCSPEVEGNEILHNQSGGYPGGIGGGIAVVEGAPWIHGNRIESNISASAGGVYCEAAAARIERNFIVGNCAAWGTGGGIACYAEPGPLIRGNRIADNFAWEIVLPWTARGGGIRCDASAWIEGNVIVGNRCDGSGGGVSCRRGGNVVLRGNIVAGNQADQWWDPAGGGLAFLDVTQARVEGNTVVGNFAGFGAGGIHAEGGGVTVTHGIVWGNTTGGGELGQITGVDRVEWSDVEGGWNGAGEGNINVEPGFVDRAGGDLRLRRGSPCIDVGCPDLQPTGTDLHGTPRLLDGDLDRQMVVDPGACEFSHVHLAVQGEAVPGGTLLVESSGTPFLIALLYVGTERGERQLPPYGPLLIDPASSTRFFPFAVLPDATTLEIPADVAVPQRLVLQELAIDLFSGNGNFSNAVEVRIE